MRPAEPALVIDREKTCPLLIRVFCKPGMHHKLEEFAIRGKEPGSDAEIQVRRSPCNTSCTTMHALFTFAEHTPASHCRSTPGWMPRCGSFRT